MPDQFVRFQAIGVESLGVGNFAGHKRCQHRNPHTTEGPRAGIPPVSLVDEVEHLEAALTAIDRDARARRGERGRRPAGCYDVLITGAPRYDGQNGGPLSEEDELKWAVACVTWLRSVLSEGVIIANAYLHRDEASPHVHVTIVPWNEESQRIDWRTCRARMAGVEPRPRLTFEGLLSKTKADGSAKSEEELEEDKGRARKIRATDKRAAGREMTAILDSYHAQVSEPFGIGRGDRGNRRRHRKVDRRKALDLEVEGAERAAKLAREREATAKTGAEAAELEAEEEEKRVKAARDDWAKAEEEEKRVRRELGRTKEELEAKRREYDQVVADIEAGRPGSTVGRELRENAAAWEKEVKGARVYMEGVRGQLSDGRSLKTALAVPGHRLDEALGEEQALELLHGRIESERSAAQAAGYKAGYSAGVQELWSRFQAFAREVGDDFLARFQSWNRGQGRERASGPER